MSRISQRIPLFHAQPTTTVWDVVGFVTGTIFGSTLVVFVMVVGYEAGARLYLSLRSSCPRVPGLIFYSLGFVVAFVAEMLTVYVMYMYVIPRSTIWVGADGQVSIPDDGMDQISRRNIKFQIMLGVFCAAATVAWYAK